MMERVAELPMASAREDQYLRLFEAHDRAVRRLATSYERDPGRRQDLVQEIWLAVWQALPSFRGNCSERTFVFRIAHNRAITHMHHWRRRATDTLPDDAPIIDRSADPEHAASQQERLNRLQAAVRNLPLAMRQVVILMLEGLAHREIAEVLGLSENNVAVRLTRARVALARELEPTGARR
jgi:RNA polymerase sigma-70 factor (ECF subfamily)